jgi:threonine dehydrogenase-like Zn-dependent dehydrogenase
MNEKPIATTGLELLPFWVRKEGEAGAGRVLIVGCGGLGGYLGHCWARAASARSVNRRRHPKLTTTRQFYSTSGIVLDGTPKPPWPSALRRANRHRGGRPPRPG